jgi:ElaB/YqjD/DUF883 family membrane-anchored ribosome-binding protein
MDPITNDDTVRRDWERQKEDVAQLAEDVGATAGEAANRAAGEAQRVAGDAKRRLRSASDRAAAAYDRTASEARRAYGSMRDYAIEHPGTAAAVTFGTGVCIGMWMARGRAMDAYKRGIVPMAAVAIANAVLEVLDSRH